jgi:hypothetical protein
MRHGPQARRSSIPRDKWKSMLTAIQDRAWIFGCCIAVLGRACHLGGSHRCVDSFSGTFLGSDCFTLCETFAGGSFALTDSLPKEIWICP